MITALILLPIIAGFACYLFPKRAEIPVKWFGVAIAVITFVLVIAASGASDESLPWLYRPFSAAFHVGFGGFGYWIALLLGLVTPCALIGMRMHGQRELTALVLMLEGAMMGVFVAKDLLLFALFWDLMLIPVFLSLITTRRASHAAWRYLIYNIVGGLTLLLATAAFGIVNGTTDVIGRSGLGLHAEGWMPWIFAGYAFAFLIKTPVWPFHTWMPETYAESAPTMVAIVSAVQSKAGLYGFIVIGIPFFGATMHAVVPLMMALGLISLLYGAFVALVQTDAKRIVAYSSLSHLGLILLAAFSFNPIAIRGAIVYAVAHGLFNAALFITLGYVERREETRDITRLGGIGGENPRLSGALMLAALAALGLPGLAGFTGEVIILTGLFQAGLIAQAFIALIPIVLAAGYMLRLFQQIMHGPKNFDLPRRGDLGWIEGLAIAPLVLAFLVLGVDPHPVTSLDEPALSSLGNAQVSYESVVR